MRSWICLSALLCVFQVDIALSAFSGGQYEIQLKHVEKCQNQGTGEMGFVPKIKKTGRTQYALSTPWYWPSAVDSDMSAQLDIYRMTMAGWSLFLVKSTKEMCQEINDLFPEMWKQMYTAAKQTEPCPLPAGNYTIKNWILDLNFNTSLLVPGNYRVDVSFKRKFNRIGCLSLLGNVVLQ